MNGPAEDPGWDHLGPGVDRPGAAPPIAVTDGDVVMAVERAEWWGASLGVLVSAVHHGRLLAILQPATDAVAVAREVLAHLDELWQAADAASAQHRPDCEPARSVAIRREDDSIVVSPGEEVANLALCLEVFARGVIDPNGPDAGIARGATAYAASAWSGDIGKAAGTLEPAALDPPGLGLDGPDFGP